MEKDDFYLNILASMIGGLIMLLGSIVGEKIPNVGLRIGVISGMCFILIIVFVKVFDKYSSRENN